MNRGRRYNTPRHPLRRWRLAEAASLAGGGAFLVFAAWWALDDQSFEFGIAPEPAADERHDEADVARASELVGVDPAAFDVALWNPPAPPPPPPPAPQPQREVAQRVPPLNVQFLAIVRRPIDGSLAAMLYDPKSDTLYTVGPGEQVMGHTVSSIQDDVVVFKAASTETRLSLMPEERR